VLGLEGANSTEFDDATPHPVIAELPEQKEIEGLGGTMRLGAHEVLLEPDTLAWSLFEPGDTASIRQRFRHRWEVEPAYIDRLTAAGLRFSGRHPRFPIMQVLELDQAFHPYFIAAQFHPELMSRPLRPHPMFMGLIAAAIARANPQIPPQDLLPGVRQWLRSARPDGDGEQPAPPIESGNAPRVSPA
jgi:CTP synthase